MSEPYVPELPEELPPTKEELMRRLREQNEPVDLKKLKQIYKKWLYLDDDDEVLDVVMAVACDRKLPGDPVWMFLISASGGTKTELVRNLCGPDIYTLDSLTPHTLISGKIEKNEDGNYEPVKGILRHINGKVLVIKDFTVILNKRREDRDDIFGQLRSLYDGYLEYAYGTSAEPVRIPATIGLIAACVPAIQMYQKLYTILGERFLTVRHKPNRKESSSRALGNLGEEEKMRAELGMYTRHFLEDIKPGPIKEEPGCRDTILNIADATAKLRTPVPIRFWHYEIDEAALPTIEYPTRLSKQLLKLARLLALVRNKTKITPAEMKTVRRVARDTCFSNRIKILEKIKFDELHDTREISELTGIPLATCWRELKEMEYLNLCSYNRQETAADSFGRTKHDPERDGWKMTDKDLYDVLDTGTLTPEPPEKSQRVLQGLLPVSVSSPPREQENRKRERRVAGGTPVKQKG